LNKLEVLKRSDMFRELNDEHLGLLERICTSHAFEAGTSICKQGKMGAKLYVIENGLVAITLEVGPMAQRQVQAASNFESFGWSAMIEPHVYTATARAMEKTTALAVGGAELSNLCSAHPDMGVVVFKAVARVVAARLHEAYVQLLGVAAEV
jgi:CRP-like cAMP-binding protein